MVRRFDVITFRLRFLPPIPTALALAMLSRAPALPMPARPRVESAVERAREAVCVSVYARVVLSRSEK